MLNIAHRGFRSKYPENTILAFKKAVEAGADGIEFDVHLTKDGEVVIIHDERLDRTTDHEGRVQDYTLEELKKVDAGKLFPGLGFQAIPTLREYLQYIKDIDIITNIELKTSIYTYDGIEKKVYDMIREFDVKDKIIISSFNHYSIVNMKKLDKDIKCGLLVEDCLYNPWEYVKRLEVEYYHPAAYCLTQEIIDKLHENNIGVNVWYGTEPYDFEKTYALKVDAMITDYPDVIKDLKNR